MLRISLFGALRAATDAPIASPRHEACRLWAYLLVHRGRALDRSEVAFTLWPDVPEDRARGRLRLALHQLTAHLAPHVDIDRALPRDRVTIAWRGGPDVWLDVEVFEAAAARGLAAGPATGGTRDALAEAEALQSRPLLEAWDEPWLEVPRRRLADELARLHARAAEEAELALDHAGAAELWGRRVAAAPLDEIATRRWMRNLYLAGDATGARAAYARWVEALAAAGAGAPSEATRALDEAIAAGVVLLPGDARALGASTPGLADGAATGALIGPPVALNGFVGRATERARLDELLGAHAIVTVVGPGGAGKTRLASETVAGRRGAAVVVWVDLADASDGVQVAEALARALGIERAARGALRDRAIAAVPRPEALVVLDNCEQVAADAGRLAEDLVADGAARVLATSRVPLGVGPEVTLALAGLDTTPSAPGRPAEALELFATRLAQRWPDYVPDARARTAMARIATLVDGLPLAIELAVARSGVLGLADIADQLEHDIEPLRDAGTRRPPRQRTMDAAIAWSVRLLSASEGALFERLGVFAGRIDTASAAAVDPDADGDEAATAERLERLAHQSLLTRRSEDGSYRMLGPIHRYARRALDAVGGVDDAATRHAAHFARFAALRADADGPAAWAAHLDALDAENANLRAALTWLRASGRILEAIAMVRSLTRFWFVRSHLEWERTTVRALLADVESLPGSIDSRPLHRALGLIAFRRGDIDEAVRRVERIVAYERLAGDPAGLGDALNHLGTYLGNRGDFATAVARFEEARALADAAGDATRRAEALGHAAAAYVRLGDAAAARGAFDALAAARDPGVEPDGNELNARALLAQLTGAYDAAEALLARGLAYFEALGDDSGAALVLNNRGRLYNDMGRYREAMASLHDALRTWRTTGRRDHELYVLNNMGEVELRKGNLPSARLLLERSLALKRERGDAYSIAFTQLNVAELALAMGEPDLAAAPLEEALATLRALGVRDLVAVAQRLGGMERLARGDGAGARRALAGALEASTALGARREVACALDALARLAGADVRLEDALRLAGASTGMRDAIGAPRAAYEAAEHARLVAVAAAGVGDEVTRRAVDEGRAWSLERILARALGLAGG